MALKFLNKKGWHTGSLRNIENVWKAEQKQEAEQKKLEELQKQIREERERAEFRQIQVEAGLISKQERLEFLYDSGLAVGKGSSGFKALESEPKTESEPAASSSAKQPAVPGALFEEKPHSSNDAWRKLHSDPLLLIRQKEQEALARIKNNPVKMAMIRKSVQEEKGKDKEEKKKGKKHRRKMAKDRKISPSRKGSGTESDFEDGARTSKKAKDNHHGGLKSEKSFSRTDHTSDDESRKQDGRTNRYRDREYDYQTEKSSSRADRILNDESQKRDAQTNRYRDREYDYKAEKASSRTAHNLDGESRKQDARTNRYRGREYDHQRPGGSHSYNDDGNDEREPKKDYYERERKKSEHEYSSEKQEESRHDNGSRFVSSGKPSRDEPANKHWNPVRLSDEERAAKLKEMQMDAELHEQQRWTRLKKAADKDAQEAIRDKASLGRNFLDATQRSVYGAEKGGASTIEESVRRRTHYSQRQSTTDSNAFRRS